MNIQIDSTFETAAENAAKFSMVDKTSSGNAYSCLKIEAESGSVRITAANGHAFYISEIPGAAGFDNGSFMVNASLFAAAIKQFQQGNITDKDGCLILKNGRKKLKIKKCEGIDFPETPEFSQDNSVKLSLPTKEFLTALQSVAYSMADESDAQNAAFSSVHINVKNNMLYLDALSGYYAARYEMPLNAASEMDVLLPSWVVEQALADTHIRESKTLTLSQTGHLILFETDSVKIITSKIACTAIDLDTVILEYPHRVRCSVKNWLEALKSADLVRRSSSDKINPVFIIEIAPESKNVSYGIRQGIAAINGDVPAEFNDGCEKIRMGFNVRFLLEAIKHIGTENVYFDYLSPLSPLQLRPVTEENSKETAIHIVLPVRLKTESNN